MAEDWVCVATVPDLKAAEVLVQALRSAGIEAMLDPSGAEPWSAGQLLSLRVVVQRSREADAKRVLQRVNRRNGHSG
ncbi:MAG: DUF2007 domain-containing protein [Chloroflexi bacterium]|nr:DUF2007 domain-containing protein [Chloroflexota bacterium]